MPKVQLKTTQLSPEQASPQNLPIRNYLSDNQSEKDFTSCASIKTTKVTKILQRRKQPLILQKPKRIRFNSPKISYISPQMLKQLGSDGENEDAKSFLSQGLIKFKVEKTPREHPKENNIFEANRFCQSALNIAQPQKQEKECCQHMKKLENLKNKYQLTDKMNKQLSLQNQVLKSELEKIKENSRNVEKQIKNIEEKADSDLRTQKQINACLEDIIEQLNAKIQDLLYQLDTYPHSYELDQDDQNQKISKEDFHWLTQTNQRLELENSNFKEKILQLKKDLRHFEFEASLTKKLREELVLEKSLRESYENKTRALTNKLKIVNKHNKKQPYKAKFQSHKNIGLQDSLSFSIQIE